MLALHRRLGLGYRAAAAGDLLVGLAQPPRRRFPLGLQSGWNLDRGCASELAASDPAKPGPSGAPSLRLGGSERCILYSEPFSVAEPGRRNRVALSFTGSGKWRLAMLQQGKVPGCVH